MSDDPVLDLMLELYGDVERARLLLISIGYPRDGLPSEKTGRDLWLTVLPNLDDRIAGGRHKLARAAHQEFPGSGPAAALLAAMNAAAPTTISVIPEQLQRGRTTPLPAPADEGAGPPPPPATETATAPRPGPTRHPTLTLEGADLPDQLEAAARELFGDDVVRLYVSHYQSAVRIPDPGERDEQVRREIQERLRAVEPTCRVTFKIYPFQPYVYRELTVLGPDTTPYRLEQVPSTMTPEDIAAELVATTREAATGRDGLVRVVVNHERAEVSHRLDPFTTLHECGVHDRDRLRVAPDAIAGGILPAARLKAVLAAPCVVWRSPVFHPNIRSTALAGLPAGTLQFHPLLTGWRPDRDCVYLAEVISDVAAYRDYDLADGPLAPNPEAARWAGTPEGQQQITDIGGRRLEDVVRQGDPRTRPSGLLSIRPVGEVHGGH